MTLGRRQIDLRRGRLDSAKQRCDRQSESPRQIVSLVEAPGSFAGRMQWDWNDEISAGQNPGSGHTHHVCEPRGDRPPAVVLQGMNDLAQTPFICADRSRGIDHMRCFSAETAPLAVREAGEQGRQRIAALVANRRCDPVNARPAQVTDSSVKWMGERCAARGARRLKEFREGEIGKLMDKPDRLRQGSGVSAEALRAKAEGLSPPVRAGLEFLSWRRCPTVDRARRNRARAARRRGPRSRSSR